MSDEGYHVSPALRGEGWSVRRYGSMRAWRVFPTKGRAIREARRKAAKAQTMVYIHNRCGTVMLGVKGRLTGTPD